MSWFIIRIKALCQLGLQAIWLYIWHQLRLRSGYLQWRTPPGGHPAPPAHLTLSAKLINLPAPGLVQDYLGQPGMDALITEADEILSGQVRLFGDLKVPLSLNISFPLQHWTAYEHGLPTENMDADEWRGDIKFTWEPGRFGWAIVLARAYHLTHNHGYAQYFWAMLDSFLTSNPTNQGPHWASAQEVALRLIALVFANQVFSDAPSSTPEHRLLLAQAIADHAARIPPTIPYARAQHNNHLISEALGLYTAGLALPDHPQADSWQALGWHWLNHALQTQIAPSGAYTQHSTNYHRLVLQAALWADALARNQGQAWPAATRYHLAAATRWLLALCDPSSGQVPNLGPNDGALILPLSSCPFTDYRPTLRAAALAFLRENHFQAVASHEIALWLGLAAEKTLPPAAPPSISIEPHCLYAPDGQSWAYLRLARYSSRPGHADQLHLDLWWKGINLAQDAGTYRYTASPPWDNALTHTAVHNTMMLHGLEQMTRAGRFLYLDWAQARLVAYGVTTDRNGLRLVAEHDGYRALGLCHRRSVEYRAQHWIIEDLVLPTSASKACNSVSARLHWLLPDLPWDFQAQTHQVVLQLQTEHGPVSLTIQSAETTLQPLLVRAGKRLVGVTPIQPAWGWTAPAYGYKIPSLSFSVTLDSAAPLSITSEWDLPSG